MRLAVGMCLGILGIAVSFWFPGGEGDMRLEMENRMDLILGGNYSSLREGLRRLDEDAGLVPEPQPEPQPKPQPRPEPRPPVAPLRVVTLGDGDTLWGLAEAHLGAGSRWRELLRLNGWSEERATNLPLGTQVKLPQE